MADSKYPPNIRITGNVGQDPALIQTKGGRDMLKFSVAVYGGKDRPAKWFNVILFDEDALSVRVSKGSRVTVEGNLSVGEYNDKEQLDIFAEAVKSESAPKPIPAVEDEEIDLGDDIPF